MWISLSDKECGVGDCPGLYLAPNVCWLCCDIRTWSNHRLSCFSHWCSHTVNWRTDLSNARLPNGTQQRILFQFFQVLLLRNLGYNYWSVNSMTASRSILSSKPNEKWNSIGANEDKSCTHKFWEQFTSKSSSHNAYNSTRSTSNSQQKNVSFGEAPLIIN